MSNVITFPKDNKRLDISNTPVTAEDVAIEISKIKMDFYHEVADELLDGMIRKIGALNLGDQEDVVINDIDIIFLRECITAFISKLAGVEHPLDNLPEAMINNLNVNDGTIDYRLSSVDSLQMIEETSPTDTSQPDE